METFYILSLICIASSLLATQYFCKTSFQAITATADEEQWDAVFDEVDQRIHSILAVDSNDSDFESSPAETFGNLRARFLSAYIFVVAADWLQGSYIYPLYRYTYNLSESEVAFLFALGFLSAGLSTVCVGVLADKFGRRQTCLAYCVLYALSCILAVSGNHQLLPLGRVLGGTSSALLYTVFEAWLLGDMQRLQLCSSEERLCAMFGAMSTCNGVVAIMSGVVSQFLVHWTGSHKTPFIGSVFCLLVAAYLIRTCWVENFGTQQYNPQSTRGEHISTESISRNVLKVVYLSLTICAVEGSMYIMVFSWPQALLSARKVVSEWQEPPPYGLIFACFMSATTLGAQLFKIHSHIYNGIQGALTALRLAMAAASASLVVSVIARSEYWRFLAFCAFELCIGAYFPSIGYLKARAVDDQQRAKWYGTMRIPLNIYIQMALVMVEQGEANRDMRLLFGSGFLMPCVILLAWYGKRF